MPLLLEPTVTEWPGPQPEPGKEGVRCPRCNCPHLYAVQTRRSGKTMIRLRRCRHCHKQIRTREVIRED